MPRRVLDVIRIHRTVRLELRTAVLETAGIVERDATLPELWQRIRPQFDQAVESSNRFHNAATSEVRYSLVENPAGLFSLRLADHLGDRKDDGAEDQRKGACCAAVRV